MFNRTIVALLAGFALVTGHVAGANVIQLDISSGFNTDNWTGYKEYQNVAATGNLDLNEVQGNSVSGGQGR